MITRRTKKIGIGRVLHGKRLLELCRKASMAGTGTPEPAVGDPEPGQKPDHDQPQAVPKRHAGRAGREPDLRHRAGRYVSQSTGYRAFMPEPLPPDPPVQLDGELQALLWQADRGLGRLDGSIQTLPNPDLFFFMYVRKEAVLSSQIEGTQSSLQDLLADEAQILSPDRPRDVEEMVNYVDAMNHGLACLAELPISIRLIKEIHERLPHGVRGSRLTPGEE